MITKIIVHRLAHTFKPSGVRRCAPPRISCEKGVIQSEGSELTGAEMSRALARLLNSASVGRWDPVQTVYGVYRVESHIEVMYTHYQ